MLYSQEGSYDIALQVSNPLGHRAVSLVVTILPQPVAQFILADSTVAIGQDVAFTNQSGGRGPLEYLWQFGDGTTSGEANPTHSYESPGEYQIRLTPDVIGQPVIGAQVGGFYGSGIYGGSYILLSDILGDHNVLLWGQIAGSLGAAAYVIKPVEPFRAESMAAAQYFPGTPDGSRPGIFYVNTYDLPARPKSAPESA